MVFTIKSAVKHGNWKALTQKGKRFYEILLCNIYDVIYISFQEICMKSYMLLENSYNQYMNRNVNSERILFHFVETLWRHLKFHPNITELQLTTFTWLQKSRNSTITLMQFIFIFLHSINLLVCICFLTAVVKKKPQKTNKHVLEIYSGHVKDITARPRVARCLGPQKQCTVNPWAMHTWGVYYLMICNLELCLKILEICNFCEIPWSYALLRYALFGIFTWSYAIFWDMQFSLEICTFKVQI